MRLLEIQSSPRGEFPIRSPSQNHSSRRASPTTARSLGMTLNVWPERLPEFGYEASGAKYKAVTNATMTEAESDVWERIQLPIRRCQNADRIVLGTPMWNLWAALQGQTSD